MAGVMAGVMAGAMAGVMAGVMGLTAARVMQQAPLRPRVVVGGGRC